MSAAATRSRKPRRPGRPQGGADLRSQALDATMRCFAEHGIAATTLRAVARSSGVTPALLHYYFGDKAKLVEAIVAERLMPVVAELREMMARSAGDGIDLTAGFVNTLFELIERHPWFPQLWVREVLCDGGALRELVVKRVAPQVPQLLAQHFGAAQRRGELNPDLDARLLVVSLVGLTLFMSASAPIWRRIFRADDIDTALLRRHTLALLDAGIDGARSRR